MSKATCTKCGFVALLKGKSPKGKETWTIKDAIGNLISQIKEHNCTQFTGGTK